MERLSPGAEARRERPMERPMEGLDGEARRERLGVDTRGRGGRGGAGGAGWSAAMRSHDHGARTPALTAAPVCQVHRRGLRRTGQSSSSVSLYYGLLLSFVLSSSLYVVFQLHSSIALRSSIVLVSSSLQSSSSFVLFFDRRPRPPSSSSIVLVVFIDLHSRSSPRSESRALAVFLILDRRAPSASSPARFNLESRPCGRT